MAVMAWRIIHEVSMSVQLAFADEQTEIFAEMVEKATEAAKREPPDIEAAVGVLSYAHCYYPSGTKQITGSRLDRAVEWSRAHTERQMIEMLRAATGMDLGTDPKAWIRAYGKQPVSSL